MTELRLIDGGATGHGAAPVIDPRTAAAARAFRHDAVAAIGAAHPGAGGPTTGAMLALFVAADADAAEIDGPAEMEAHRRDPPPLEVARVLRALVETPTAAAMGAAAGLLCAHAPAAVGRVLPDLAAAMAALSEARGVPAHRRVPPAVLPLILHRTVATLSAKAAAGAPVRATTVTRVAVRHAAAVLGSADAVAEALDWAVGGG